jgi:cell division GTPase FtsZ
MSAISETEHEGQKETIIDDISQVDEVPLDLSKLAKLKMMNKERESMASKIVATKERTLNFGIIGSGQCGAKIAQSFYALGYQAVAINTCMADLKHIEVPDSNKLLLEYGVGGAAKELSLGAEAASSHRGEIAQIINDKLADSQVNVLCFSLGGGSGAGSCETMIDVLSEIGKPIIVIACLPQSSDDVQTKSNSLETLGKLAVFVRSKKIANLVVVDNAKIESIYKDANQFDFFELANKAIVETIDTFNTLSTVPSSVKTLDGMEWSKILLDGDGLSVYGDFVVTNYQEDTSIAEAVVNNLSGNLLASSFDLKDAKYVGFLLVANKEVWSKIPSSSISYATAMVNDLCGSPSGVFKGVYSVDIPEDCVKVYSFFSGLGIPTARIDQLKKEITDLQSKVKEKNEQRSVNLKLDVGKGETLSAADQVKQKIAAKSSTFGRFVSGTVDRRK